MARVIMAVHSDYVHDRRVRNQAQALTQAGHEVTVLCAGRREASDTSTTTATTGGVKLIIHHLRHDAGKKRFLEMMRAYRATMSQMQADIIHAHDLDTLLPCSLAAKGMGAKLVYDSHELYTESVHVAHRPLIKMVWRIVELTHIHKADAVVTVCDGIAAELKERYRLHDMPQVVRNFSDAPSATEGHVPEALTTFRTFHPKCLLYQGYIQRGRGLDQAIEALCDLPDWGLVVCGQGPYESTLNKKALQLNVDEQILWLGMLDHATLFNVTKSCDLGLCLIEPISLSYYYALPNKLVEYVQAGLPVAGSNLPEIKRIMTEFSIGWIVTESEPLELLMRSFDSLKTDKKLVAGMRLASESLTWQNEKTALLSVYSTLLK